MTWYALYEIAQQRATELAHLAEQDYMYERIVNRAERTARRIERRHARRVRLAAMARLGSAPEHHARHIAQRRGALSRDAA